MYSNLEFSLLYFFIYRKLLSAQELHCKFLCARKTVHILILGGAYPSAPWCDIKVTELEKLFLESL